MREVDVAYAAGLFDGEGCATTKWPKRPSVTLAIEMTSKPCLIKFAKIVGGKVTPKTRRGTNLLIWKWSAYDNAAIRTAKLLLPYSIEKKPQLEALIKFKDTQSDKRKTRYANKIKALKKKEYKR